MHQHNDKDGLRNRLAPLEMSPDEFRRAGHRLIDDIAEFLDTLPGRPVAPQQTRKQLQAALGTGSLPEQGTPAEDLLRDSVQVLFDGSLYNGHPRFWGYITSSAAPIGALGDLLAATINPNVGAWSLSPAASEIEAQVIRWIAEMIGYPVSCGGLLVSGGNMANFVGFLAGRRAKLPWDARTEGLCASGREIAVYVSEETHTWIQKAADLFGLGLKAIRWIPVNAEREMDIRLLEQRIMEDEAAGVLPLLVVGTAGTVGVGAVDPLPEIAAVCRAHDLWFHVDGAYGVPAAVLPEAPAALRGLALADSIALDPHKWLYSPLEAGCTLVRDATHLVDAFSFHPTYYNFDGSENETPLSYHELGMQNSCGFRALKVWLGLRQVGKEGYVRMIRDDISLAEALYELVQRTPTIEAITQNLSITTFRYVPEELAGDESAADYVDELNHELLNRLQAGGEAYVSNAVINGMFVLRACIVNFRTTLADIEALPGIVARIGAEVDAELRPAMIR